jgi:hypothetical protein
MVRGAAPCIAAGSLGWPLTWAADHSNPYISTGGIFKDRSVYFVFQTAPFIQQRLSTHYASSGQGKIRCEPLLSSHLSVCLFCNIISPLSLVHVSLGSPMKPTTRASLGTQQNPQVIENVTCKRCTDKVAQQASHSQTSPVQPTHTQLPPTSPHPVNPVHHVFLPFT